jgi:hypothetical protein
MFSAFEVCFPHASEIKNKNCFLNPFASFQNDYFQIFTLCVLFTYFEFCLNYVIFN